MSYYYPQAAVKLRILPEDFKLVSDASLQRPYEVIVQAKNLSITSNDYKTTDTFNMKLDYKNFPFDPRTIRACGVVIYLQDMAKIQNLVPSNANAVFAGFVDTETINLDDSKQEVSFEGRDFTSLMIDQKYLINAPISEQQPLDQAIREFLKQVPALRAIVVVNRTGDELPSLGKFYPDHASPLQGQKNPGHKDSYWTLIQDACARAGLICFMQLENLIITTPKNQATTAGDDIKFIYGRNIKSLEFKRKLGRIKGINISVRSRVGKEVIQAKIPFDAEQSWCDAFGVKKAEVTVPVLLPTGQVDDKAAPTPAPYLGFNIPKIAVQSQLIKIGQTLYEQYSLQQLEGELSTKEMIGHGPVKSASAGAFTARAQTGTQLSSAKKYDLTQLKKGQSLSIEIATDDLDEIGRYQDRATREQYLMRKGYKREVAALFAKTMGKFSPRMQVKSYIMNFDQDSGFDLKVQFQNILITTQAGL